MVINTWSRRPCQEHWQGVTWRTLPASRAPSSCSGSWWSSALSSLQDDPFAAPTGSTARTRSAPATTMGNYIQYLPWNDCIIITSCVFYFGQRHRQAASEAILVLEVWCSSPKILYNRKKWRSTIPPKQKNNPGNHFRLFGVHFS